MRHRHRLVVCLLPCLLLAAACGRAPEPVATLQLDNRNLELPHGRLVSLGLDWQPSKPLAGLPEGVDKPLVFVHLLDAQGNVARTFDHEFPAAWSPGRAVRDRVPLYHSAIGPALPAGDYRLTVGLYDGKEKRFALQLPQGEELKRQEYVAAQVKVPATSPSAPAFTFSPEWAATEPGGDRQAVARRWLAGDGSLEARGVPAPARVSMLLRIPKIEAPLRLLLDPGATVATARVSANCGVGFSADVAGEGFHELAVPVQTAAPCAVVFDTNYAVVEMGTGRKLSLGLEQLGWEPTAAAAAPPTP
jgi:hypothetical protein